MNDFYDLVTVSIFTYMYATFAGMAMYVWMIRLGTAKVCTDDPLPRGKGWPDPRINAFPATLLYLPCSIKPGADIIKLVTDSPPWMVIRELYVHLHIPTGIHIRTLYKF
jgi:hypothetical protein